MEEMSKAKEKEVLELKRRASGVRPQASKPTTETIEMGAPFKLPLGGDFCCNRTIPGTSFSHVCPSFACSFITLLLRAS